MSDEYPESLFQGFRKSTPNLKAGDELKSRLIASYEQAIHNGLAPCCALAVMLEWVAEEFARIRADVL